MDFEYSPKQLMDEAHNLMKEFDNEIMKDLNEDEIQMINAARIENFQNSKSQINPSNDMTPGNSSFYSKMSAMNDEMNMARKLGRKKKRK